MVNPLSLLLSFKLLAKFFNSRAIPITKADIQPKSKPLFSSFSLSNS